ncbi:MAG: hypothetical protein LBQ40_01000 [Clostridiales bacterium]|jgi:hypothetical protein|nr:hypothetical protein [Clostridiales bacterium]
MSHDERGRVTKQEIYTAGSETAREYDYTYKPGRLESVLHALTLPNGTIEKPEYDGLGRTVETNTVLLNSDKLLGSRQ